MTKIHPIRSQYNDNKYLPIVALAILLKLYNYEISELLNDACKRTTSTFLQCVCVCVSENAVAKISLQWSQALNENEKIKNKEKMKRIV